MDAADQFVGVDLAWGSTATTGLAPSTSPGCVRPPVLTEVGHEGVEMTMETFDDDVMQAWGELETALAEWLEAVPPDGCVILELPWPQGSAGTAPYVQLRVDGYDVHAEASADEVLAEVFRLGDGRWQALVDLGWHEPGEDDDEDGDGQSASGDRGDDVSANFFVDGCVPDDAEELASRLVTTLRDVFGVPDPAFLEARGFDDDGPLDGDALPFGLRIGRPVRPPVDRTTHVAKDADELRDLVAAVVERVTGDAAAFDPDGDIPVPAGSTTAYVRVDEDVPHVKVFAALLHDVPWRPRVGHALNDINQRLLWAHVVHQDEHLVVHVSVPALPFVPEHLTQLLKTLPTMVDDVAARLQRRVGGLLMSGSTEEGA